MRGIRYPNAVLAQRLIDAIDSLRPATETLSVYENRVLVRTETIPATPWSPIFNVSDPPGPPAFLVAFGPHVDPAWEGVTVPVGGIPHRIPTLPEAVDREPL